MKKILYPLAFTGLAFLTGCAAGPYASGAFFTAQKAPVTATGEAKSCAKKGESVAVNYLGFVALGDASIEAARQAGGITTVTSVDYDNYSILGFYNKTTTIVCGE